MLPRALSTGVPAAYRTLAYWRWRWGRPSSGWRSGSACLQYKSLLLVVGILAATWLPTSGASAQPSLRLVDAGTQVRSIRFAFTDTQSHERSELQQEIALTTLPPFAGLKRRLAFLPFLPEVGEHPFFPVVMAKDAVRLEQFYRRNGFLAARVDWSARLDTARNEVRVLYVITEGPPVRVRRVVYLGPAGRPVVEQFPADVRDAWTDLRRRTALAPNEIFRDAARVRTEGQVLNWVHDQGYPFAGVTATAAVDSAARIADVTVTVEAGPRARIGEVEVEGATSVRPGVLMRELPFKRGSRYSHRALVEGQRQVFGLDLIQTALVDVPENQPVDSTVAVRLRVREGLPRVIAADAGYFSESGLTGEATWTHRNFFGGARTLTARATAQTGLGAFVDDPDRLYRVSLTLRQPYVVDYRFALSGSAFAEDRETFLDESTAFGGSATLTYAPAPLTTASLRYDFETRNVRSFGFDFAGDSTAIRLIDVFNFLLLDTGRIDQSILSLSGTYGLVDNPLSPRRGFLLNPSIELAGPALVSSVEYSRLRIRANGFVPLTRSVGLRARLTGGWLAPFGQSLPSEQRDGFFTLLQLRSNAFFAGGTGDVRGWGDNLLGPKILDLTFREAIDETTSDTTVVFTASPYFPVGSLTKLAGSLGVDLPFPGLGPRWGTHAFIDGGRVWTTDERFDPGGGFLVGSAYGDEERFFFSVGGGVSVATPIGDVRLSLGYKLNPSFFDLRDPTDIAAAVERVFLTNEDPTNAQVEAAIRAVEPAELPVFQLFSIPERSRYHIHFSIGQTF